MVIFRISLGLLSLLLSGCLGNSTGWTPPVVVPLSVSRVSLDGEALGQVREIEIQGAHQPVRMWLVENQHSQSLGWIDAGGRAFRHLPHRKEGKLICTGSIGACLQALMALPKRPQLEKLEGK